MANRFPLVLNTNSNQLQELASGDTLDLTGSGLNLTGITTLSSSAQLNLNGGTNINTGTRGDILFYNASGIIQKLSLGSSGKVLKSNGSDIVYGDSGQTANVYYVSTSGQDASGRGGSVDTAFRSIKYACSNISTPTATTPAIIFVKAGVYEESLLPIVVPAFTTIAGDSLRATIVKPASGLDSGGSIQNNRSILFRMSNATVLQDLVMDGMGGYTPGSPNYKPESATVGGTYLALNAASVISTKSPYIYNCTSFGDGATGAVLDGSLHASGNRSMLFHTYTAVHSDGLGIWLKNNANAEMISTFTYYCTIGFAVTGGSKIRSLNSSNAYGEYGVYSAGFDSGETANSGTIKGQMLVYTNVLTTSFTDGEQITGGTSGATAYVVNVQAEPKRIYIVQRSGNFQSSETVTGGSSGATATLTSGTATVNQSGRILVTTFSTAPDAGDSLQFASTDGNAFQIQSVSSVTANGVAYKVLVFATSRATAVASDVAVHARKEFSLARLTGHDFLQVGTGGTDTTNWPNNPTQSPNQDYQIQTNETDPGRVYYTATDDLGNFYVGDQFKVDQATGNVTLDASAFNLSGLESLRLGSVGGLIGAAVGEFSTDITMSQNSDTKVSTQKAVKTYVDTLDGVTPVGGTFTVAGISTVTGTTQFTKQLNVSGVSTFHNNVDLLDGDQLRLGSSQDLQLYHDSNHSYIVENGTGDLRIKALTGGVELYHNDILRLSTSTTGVSIGGSLSVDGVLTYEDVTNVDSIGIITARTSLNVGSNIQLGNAGIITATSYRGDGSQLTGVDATTVKDTGGNIIIAAQASGAMVSGIVTFTSTGAIDIPVGTDAQRPSVVSSGMIRFNSTSGQLEYYSGTSWLAIAVGAPASYDLSDWQGLPAGNYNIVTAHGTVVNVEMIIQDSRNWIKIPWGTQNTSGTTSATYFWTNNTSYQTFGSVNNGNLVRDGSNRFHNDNETSGPNVNAKQVSHDTGILYRYSRVYCTAIQSHTGTSSGIPNPDWGSGYTSGVSVTSDLSGGFGDHPYWYVGSGGGGAHYRTVEGNTGGSGWVSGSSGGWSGGEAGNVTRSFTSGTVDGGSHSFRSVGLGIAGGRAEYYRHNSGYFLLS